MFCERQQALAGSEIVFSAIRA